MPMGIKMMLLVYLLVNLPSVVLLVHTYQMDSWTKHQNGAAVFQDEEAPSSSEAPPTLSSIVPVSVLYTIAGVASLASLLLCIKAWTVQRRATANNSRVGTYKPGDPIQFRAMSPRGRKLKRVE